MNVLSNSLSRLKERNHEIEEKVHCAGKCGE